MVNTQLLDEKIGASGLKVKYIIEKLGLSRNGFDKKRKNKTPFRGAEMYVLCDLLDIRTEEDKKAVFYADEVESNTNEKSYDS